MYMAGRTRPASSPSRMRIASTPYSASPWSGFVGGVSFMSPVARSVASRAAHRAAGHVVDAPQRPEALRPAGVRARHQGLPPPRDLRAQGARPLLVQLRVEVVEQGHRGAAGLLAVDLEAGEGQGQEEAPGLPGRRPLRHVAPGEEELDRGPEGAGEAPP